MVSAAGSFEATVSSLADGALLTFCVCLAIPSCFLSEEQLRHICMKAKGLALTANSLATKGSSPSCLHGMREKGWGVEEWSGWMNLS